MTWPWISVCEERSARGEDGNVRVEKRLKIFVYGMTFVYVAQRSGRANN